MILLIISLIFAAVGVGIIGKGKVTIDDGRRGTRDFSLRPIGAGVLIVGFILFALDVFTIVPTRNIAVTTAFGKPTGTLTNGFHLVAPWDTVTNYDATIQTLDMSGADGGDSTPTLAVRIANGATARMNATVNWRIDANADIQQLHMDWREFGALEQRVVKPRLQDSMPKGMYIDRLQLPFVEYPAPVQEALNAYQKELAATQVAIQQKATALEQKAALDILNSAKLTPEAFLQQCLIMTERLANQGKQISLTWTCVAPNPGAALALK